MPSGKKHFLDIPKKTASSGSAPYALLPIPYEKTTSFGKGTKNGPARLIAASMEIDTVDEELLLPVDVPVQTLPQLRPGTQSPAAVMKKIYSTAARLHKSRRFVMGIGGEHSVSYPLIKAASEAHSSLSVLQFDAHLDLRSKYSGSRYSHASAMRRVVEDGIHTVHAGIRSLCSEELEFAREANLPVFFARYMLERPVKKIAAEICKQLRKNVYITFDVDAFDPSIMPGTGTPEPGGLGWYFTIDIIKEVVRRKNLVSADVVELSPVPGSNTSEYVAARLAQKILTYHWHRDALL